MPLTLDLMETLAIFFQDLWFLWVNYAPSKPLTLDLYVQKGLISSKRVLQKNEWKKVVDKLLICKIGSVHFWHKIHPKKLRILQAMVQSFNEVQS